MKKQLLALLLSLLPLSLAAQSQWIVWGSNVRVRQNAEVTSTEMAKLSMGTVLKQEAISPSQSTIGGVSSYWYQFSIGGKKGWVFGGFLRPYTAAQKNALTMELARFRFSQQAINFLDEVDLVNFLEKTIPSQTIPALKGELELYRLLALSRAGSLVEFGDDGYKEPYRSWLKNRMGEGKDLFGDDVSGRVLVPSKKFWDLATKYKTASIGERIAYEAAQNPLGGECEGDLTCGLIWYNVTTGEYLRRYPKGINVQKLLEELSTSLTQMTEMPADMQEVYPEAKTDFLNVCNALRRAVSGTNVAMKGDVLQQLETIKQWANKK